MKKATHKTVEVLTMAKKECESSNLKCNVRKDHFELEHGIET